jgi:cyanophycinase
MPGDLVLVGGGEWTEGCTFDRPLLEASGADEVVVLPTGSAYENPGRVVARAEAWFDGLGARARPLDVLTRADALLEEHVAVVRRARFVYLVGTSPMHLRSVLKDSPLLEALVDAWQGGAVVAGSGAGADVLCDPMVDTRGGAFTVGLGLVPVLAVIPRANQWSPEKVHRTVELAPPDLPVATLPEATALIRSGGGTWRTEGVGDVVVHRGGAVVGLDALPPG